MKKQNDRSASRPSISRDADENRSIDKRSGSERLDESRSASSSEDLSKDKMVSSPQRERTSNVRTDDVRDLNTIDRTASRQRESGSSSETSFEGQGGSSGSERGTGKTSERSSHLDDDSLSGKPSRQGLGSKDKSSSDRSSSFDRSDSPSRSDRISEDKSSRDLDRSKM